MENTSDNQIADVADMKLLSGKAHEYVVNFRHRFLTYFALPLFLLFIALSLAISWLVFVPARSEHSIRLDANELILQKETELYLQSKNETLKSAHVNYILDNGSVVRLDCRVTDSGKLKLTELPRHVKAGSPIEATLVVFANEDRFLFKLLDELAKNLKVKKPPVSKAE